MVYKYTYNRHKNRIESGDLITDADVSDALRYSLIDLWTVNLNLLDKSSVPNFEPRPPNQQKQNTIIDHQILSQLQVTTDGLTKFLPLSTNLLSKKSANFYIFQWISEN